MAQAQFTPQRLGSPEWPACWLFYKRGERLEAGARMRVQGERAEYACPCGDRFTRTIGDQCDETAAWIAAHVEHLSAEERSAP